MTASVELKHFISMIVVASFLSACGGGNVNPNDQEPGNQNSSNALSSQQSSAVQSSSSPSTDPGLAVVRDGYVELPNGRGGTNVEAITYTEDMGFDKQVSLQAFENTLYPVLRQNCSGCHNTQNTSGSGAQAPIHADENVALAHEYALTRVNFRDPERSKLVVRMGTDRHNCFAGSCDAAAEQMLDAVNAWRNAVIGMVPDVPRSMDQGTQVSEQQVLDWIAEDQATLSSSEREFIKYTSFHELQNAGVSAQNMNHARVGLSKALNSVARWAPEIVNPVDVNGKGILYKFDIRDYWGYTLIDTSGDFELFYGGSDDDLAFGSKVDLNGNSVSYFDLEDMRNTLKPDVTRDDKFARLAWARVLKGNAEGADQSNESLPPFIDGFIGPKQPGPNGQDYIAPEDLEYVEASQLTFTLTRPDVYNAIMAIPGYSHYLEEELGVDKSQGMDSYDYMLTYEAITVDSRMYWRAEQSEGRADYYWKTFDTFTTGGHDVDAEYQDEEQRYPFWANPIPEFISTQQGGTSPDKYAMVATINLFADGSSGQEGGGHFDGSDGGQQSAEEVIWSLPNGLQGYALFGGFNQRRVDAFTNIVRDPRLVPDDVDDKELDNLTGFGRSAGIPDVRLNNGSSCIGCHIDGMNRGNNDLRDWLDENPSRLPSGQHGVDGWIDDQDTVDRVRELYPTSEVMRAQMEDDRRVFLEAMGKIKEGMVLGIDKNVYLEPTIWTIEWAREFYDYPYTRSN